MAVVSRTLGPLHLEDLEPHRFEDLVRQLAYDFRDWQQIEATGRTGSDEGFDARAWEKRDLTSVDEDSDIEDEEQNASSAMSGIQWLIQCKREKAIGPKKLSDYIKALPTASDEGLHGIIFAAATDFSMEARRAGLDAARDSGFHEVVFWGKGEIEDQLYQPKNDHLLFAYFGISLQVRRRSARANVRSRLAAKRKAKRVLYEGQTVLIRFADDDRYPYLDEDSEKSRGLRGNWLIAEFQRCTAHGLRFLAGRHRAYFDAESGEWDFARFPNDAIRHWDDPWLENEKFQSQTKQVDEILKGIPEQHHATFELQAFVPYDRLIEIDAEGDEFCEHPHIFVDTWDEKGMGPFYGFIETLTASDSEALHDVSDLTRTKLFIELG